MLTVDPVVLFLGAAVGALLFEFLQMLAERFGFADAKLLTVPKRLARGASFAAVMTLGVLLASMIGGGTYGVIAGGLIAGTAAAYGWMVFSKILSRRANAL